MFRCELYFNSKTRMTKIAENNGKANLFLNFSPLSLDVLICHHQQPSLLTGTHSSWNCLASQRVVFHSLDYV